MILIFSYSKNDIILVHDPFKKWVIHGTTKSGLLVRYK